MLLAGSKLKEIRLPIDNRSIAGHVANNKKFVNIPDAYNSSELQKYLLKSILTRAGTKSQDSRPPRYWPCRSCMMTF